MQIQNPVLTGSLTLNGLNITTGNLVTTGSNVFVGNQTITGSVNITGSLNTTGSISLERGSLRIGDGAGGFSGFRFSSELRQTNNNVFTLLGALKVESTAGATSYISGSGGLAIGKGTATSYLDISGSTLITGSLGVTGPITGSAILSTGRITAQTLVVSTISSSVTFSSGSNIFGNSTANTQTMTGSVNITGSLTITTAGTSPEFQVVTGGTIKGNALTDIHQVTGSLRVTGSSNHFILGCNVGINTTVPSTKLHICNPVNQAYSPTSFNGAPSDLHALHIQFCDQNQRAGLIRWTSHGNLENTFGVVQIGCSTGGTGCGQGDFVFQAYRDPAAYSELMRLTRLGNVGIGTSSPSSVLTVSGSNTSCLLLVGSPGASSALFVSGSGNVGIGTTTPTPHNGCGALIIQGIGASRGIMEIWDGTSGKSVFQNVGGDTYIGQLCKGSGNGDVFFLTGGTGISATVSMTIKCAGNVGIRTCSPSAVLTVSGSNTSCLLLVGSPSAASALFVSGSGNVGIGITSPTNPLHIQSNTLSQLNVTALSGNTNAQINLEPVGTGIALIGPANPVDFVFRTNATERVRISSAGTASFTANALANSADAATINLKQNSTTANTGIYLERSGEQKGYYMYVGGSVDSLTFQRNNAGTKADVMALSRDGNVGIGITTPCERFEVAGITSMNIRLYGRSGVAQNNLSSNIYYNGTVWTRDNLSYGAQVIRMDTTNGGFYIDADNTTSGYPCTRFFICAANGNVGIGTNNPTGAAGLALALNGGANQTRIALKNNTTGDGAGDGFQILLNTDGEANIEQRENAALKFLTNTTERMLITAAGTIKQQSNQAIGACMQSGTIANNTCCTVNLNSAGGNNSIGFIAIGVNRPGTNCGTVRMWSQYHTQTANTYSHVLGNNEGGITITNNSDGGEAIINCSGGTVNYVIRYLSIMSQNAITDLT